MSVRMVWDLLHEPVWLGGVGSILAGFLLQAAALATGPIALVQPILITELPLTLLLAGKVFHTRLRAREWASIVGMSVGLALLLVTLAPGGGDARRAPGADWAIGSGITVVLVTALVVAGGRNRGARRAAYLGVATGVTFGFTAALVAGMIANGGAVFTAWQTYAVIVVGPAGFFLLQHALRAGRLVASQPGMTLANPLVAIAWGVTVFGEHVHGGAWIAGELAGAALIAACTLLLTRSPLLQDDQGASEHDTDTREAEQAHDR
jgi:drug/metabolite transporter (DMT)-like permease